VVAATCLRLMLDGECIAPKRRLPLARLANHVSVEVFEPQSSWPPIEWPDGGYLVVRSVVPLTECRSAGAAEVKFFRHRRYVFFPNAVISRTTAAAKFSESDAMMIAARQ